ncbi:MAG: fibrobacter succinogenes major paralogous domain-containing protein [Bacteroidia bacterium]|nr:fibrobacter succinogenes major paralogous domain-containing protein [Bacteroidia bacterium]
MKKAFYLLILSLLSISLLHCTKDEDPNPLLIESVSDADGNIYNTIKIGNQTWMLENLKTTKYNDGTPITEYTFGDDWHNGNNPVAHYQWANTDDLNNVHDEELPFDYYGAMYNHFAIESGKLAPAGWRIPTVQDFIELENYLSNNGYSGMETLALKSESGWLAFSGNGTNDIGFNSLPNGYVSAVGTPTLAEGICTWATTDVNTSDGTRIMIQLFDQNSILYSENAIQIGAGIRCIME